VRGRVSAALLVALMPIGAGASLAAARAHLGKTPVTLTETISSRTLLVEAQTVRWAHGFHTKRPFTTRTVFGHPAIAPRMATINLCNG
jgi:hypothetical protein